MHKQPDLPSKRLFFALPCEPAQRRAIAQWRNTLGHLEGRPIAGENFHLTLMFLGEVAVSELPGIYAAAARVCVPGEPLRIRLDQLQAWHRAGMLVLVPGAPALVPSDPPLAAPGELAAPPVLPVPPED